MTVNAKAKIIITHSKRPFQTIEKTWSALVFEWFGPKDPRVEKILNDLKENKRSVIEDSSGVCIFTTSDEL